MISWRGGLISPNERPQEQECFQEELRRAQRRLLRVSRDKR